jgi:hypothetical protein
MEHVIAAYLQCIANFASNAADLASEEPCADTDAQELLLLAQNLLPLYAVQNAAHAAQCSALDTLEAQCFNKLSSYTRDYMQEVYTVMHLLRNDEL